MPKNDGGPAFPLQYDPYIDHPTHGRVHRTTLGEDVQEGMSLRDYFAGQALLSSYRIMDAKLAYQYADEMLKEREKINA